MRALLIVGSLVAATLIPWDSLTLPGAGPPSGRSDTQAGSAPGIRPLAARLSPALGIIPLSEGIECANPGPEGALVELPQSPRSLPPGVVCKDGVCTIPTRESSAASERAPQPDADDFAEAALSSATRPALPSEDLTWEQARERLRELGATHFRLENDSERGQYRFWCRLPVKGQTNVGRQFEAWASTDMEAVIQTLAQVEAWTKARR